MFVDRVDAGRQLGAQLAHLLDDDVVVVGLPRGGVPVAWEVAKALEAPLDIILVRKLGVPFQPELGMGAIGENGHRVVNADVVDMAQVSTDQLASIERKELVELQRRGRTYRSDRRRVPLTGRVVVIVDDGIATGSTAKVACKVARAEGASRVILAVPVAPPGWTERIEDGVDEHLNLVTPAGFHGIGQFYDDFTQVSDAEVIDILDRAQARGVGISNEQTLIANHEVQLTIGDTQLTGQLTVPDRPVGLVLFAHGSGSSRHSPRNRFVAAVLNKARLGTLLLDLLTGEEETDRNHVFDVDLLALRLVEATAWVRRQSVYGQLPLGYFGASTGAGAALVAAASPSSEVVAVVSRGGRPDLAADRLAGVTAPTLLIVGGDDDAILNLNRQANDLLRCPAELVVVPGAGHLFEEPGTLRQVAVLAREWFLAKMARDEPVSRG